MARFSPVFEHRAPRGWKPMETELGAPWIAPSAWATEVCPYLRAGQHFDQRVGVLVQVGPDVRPVEY